MISIILKLSGVTEPNIATGIPNTTHILKILLPIILPIRRSCSPFLDEVIVVVNSGKDVPKAMIVKEITPIVVAISLAFLSRPLLL